jgi:hypothetical protein
MLLADTRGVALSIIVTAANHDDVTQLVPTLDAVVIARPADAARPLAPVRRCRVCRCASQAGHAQS